MKHTLIYDRPAEQWHDCLPLGNGRIGAMVCGDPNSEIYYLNEDSIWSGSFRDRNNPKALENLPLIREYIRNGDTQAAQRLCEDSFYGTNEQQRHYQPLGELRLYQDGEYENYSHTLDMSRAVDTVRFTVNGNEITRETFISYPHQVMVIVLRSARAGGLDFTALIDGRDDWYDDNRAYDDSTLLFTASDGIPFACAVTVTGEGCRTDANRIVCRGGTSAVITIGAQTAYRTADYVKLAVSQAKSAARYSPERLITAHILDFTALFGRAALDISEPESTMTTDKRLEALRNGDESQLPVLAELYFDYSRYLMISGSREGTLPLNLQGIWNKDMWPAWGCKYTININTEMNYWGAEIQNLSECHMPLFDHIERMRENGRVTARRMYGCNGSVCHHNTDIWGDTAPQDKWLPGTLWPMGLAWLCTHIWEHYLFTRDIHFLDEKLDTMLEACEFFLDFLTENKDGRLVTNPSLSPENTYFTANGEKGTLCEGPSMDSQILHTLFDAVIKAVDELDCDSPWSYEHEKELVSRIRAAKERLPVPEVGKYGQICEWAEDYDEVEPGHRHISQLYGLYPSDLIRYDDERLAKAARATLDRRLSHGGGHTGWSRAWIINMWARLHDGAKVEENIRSLLTGSTADSMLDMHPPFQIDGNFGGGAGICEALMQSVDGVIEFLPALPPSWKKGSFRGLCARGGFVVSLEWDDSRLVSAEVCSRADSELVIRTDVPLMTDGSITKPENGVIRLFTEHGKTYHFIPYTEDHI